MDRHDAAAVIKGANPAIDSEPANQINYSLERLEFDEGDRTHIIDQLKALKSKYGINGKTIVEFGCGFGHNLRLFSSDNTVSGLEGLSAAVERAVADGLNVELCDLNGPTALASSSVDVVICLDVLEHLVEPATALGEMRRVLRSHGLAILNVPNHFDMSGRLKILLGKSLDTHRYFPDHDEWNNPHIRYFTHSGFVRFVTGSGFQIIDDRSSFITSFPLQSQFIGNRFVGLRSRLSARFPALFSAGHFLVAQKTD